MAKEKPATKICKHCKTEIPYDAKICPQCRGKNKGPFYKRPWFIILVIIIVIGVVASAGGGKDSSETSNNNIASSGTTNTDNSSKNDATQQESEPEIEYTAYDVSELMDDLNGNALKAADKYKGQYVELTGKLSTIDSSGKYISIVSTTDEWAIIGVTCYIKNDDQKQAIMEMSTDDTVVVKGKIKDVGEVFGYYLDIDEIVK